MVGFGAAVAGGLASKQAHMQYNHAHRHRKVPAYLADGTVGQLDCLSGPNTKEFVWTNKEN
jgi:hypothetical protein